MDLQFQILAPLERKLTQRTVVVRGWCLDAEGSALRGMRARLGDTAFKVRRKLPSLALMAKFPENEEAGFSGFEVDVELPGGKSKLVLEAKDANGKWHELTILELKAPRLFPAESPDPFDFSVWYTQEWDKISRAKKEIERLVDALPTKPQFTIVAENPEFGRKMMRNQLYDQWEMVPVGTKVSEGYVLFLGDDDDLAPHALFEFADAINRDPSVLLVYCDEFYVGSGVQKRRPQFKPDFDPVYLREKDYVTRSGAFHADLFDGQPATTTAALKAAERLRGEQVLHIPSVLYHNSRSAVDDSRSVVPEVPENEPRVALIIPTRDRLSLLKQCVDTVRANTDYENYGFVVVDNGSEEQETLDYFKQFEGKVIDAPGPFNYAGLNNRAVKEVTDADIVVLLNNDIEVPEKSRGWLGALVGCIASGGVGAVGARLLYPDGKIQHSGVFLGFNDAAGHLYHGLEVDSLDLMMRRDYTHSVSAVTGACLAVSRDEYLAVGGMDEEIFAVNYNDVDLCLKLSKRGLYNVLTPHAELIHHESASRGGSATDEQKARAKAEMVELYKRWGDRIAADPFYNPNLTLWSEDCSLAWPSRYVPPWKNQGS